MDFALPTVDAPKSADLPPPEVIDVGGGERFGARVPVTPVPEPTEEQKLNLAQTQARGLRPPAEAKVLLENAKAKGVPFSEALLNPVRVGGAVPYEPLWEEHSSNKPLSNALTNPETAVVLAPEDVAALAKAGNFDKEPLSTTWVGQQDERSALQLERSNIYGRMMINGGVMSPEDANRFGTINTRLEMLAEPRGVGEQIASGVIGQGRVMLEMAKGSIAGGAAGFVAGAISGPGSVFTAAAGAMLGSAVYSAKMNLPDLYGTLRENGIPHSVALPMAILGGTPIVMLDVASFGSITFAKVLGKAGVSKVAQANAKRVVAEVLADSRFARIVTEMAKDAAKEMPAEMAQELVGIIDEHASAALSPEGGVYKTPSLEEGAGRILMAGAVAGPAAIAMGSFGTFARELTVKASSAEVTKRKVDRLYDTTKDLTDVPADVKEKYGNDVAAQGSVQTVSVPIAELDTLLQKAEPSPDLKSWLARPETQRNLDAARAGGTRVTLTLGEFIAFVRPLDEAKTLAQEIGFNDGMSTKEAKELKPAVTKARKEMADLAKRKEQVDNGPEGLIRQDIEQKLLAVGATKDGARFQAELIASGLATLAQRTGQDPYEMYRSAPLDITRKGFERGGTAMKYLTERLLVASPEVKTRERFYDANTGLPNENALALQPKAKFYYFADPEGMAFLNDKGGGHGHADLLARSHARNLLALDPTVHRAFGGFIGTANSAAEARAIVEKANAAAEVKGFTMDVQVAESPEAAVEAMKKWKADLKAREEGLSPEQRTRALRGERPLGADPALAPKDYKFSEQGVRVPTSPEMYAAQAKMTPAEAHAVYVKPDTRVLTNRGWAVARSEHKKRFLLSGDAAGIGVLDRKYGKMVADQVMAQVEHTISLLSGENFDAAHPHGDEIMAQHGNEAELRAFGERLRQELEDAKFDVYDEVTNKAYTINGIAFGFEVATNEKATEEGLNADKERLAVEGKRDRKNAGTNIIDARVVERAVSETDLRSDARDRGVVSGDLGGRESPADQGGAGRLALPDQVVPGFSEVFSKSQVQLGADGVRGSISFDPVTRDWFKITLTGRANFSTFLHESSHYLLEMMRKYGDAPGIAEDLRALEEWAGVKPGEEWSTDALEKFARGMETYFGEGRAPSAKLAAAFATFKTWILHVYNKVLGNLNAPLTDEVRAVMDRMLATQQEIGARQLELGYFPSSVLIEEGGMSGPEQQLYRDLYEKGARQAQVELDREAIAAFRREKTEEYRQIAEDVDKELDQNPVISLRAWLAGEGRTDGGLVPDLNGTKIDAALVPDRYKKRLGDTLAMVGGVDPDEIAPFFGFRNKGDMFEALVSTPERSVMKAREVKAEMTKRYPAYGPDPLWVEETALERLHEADSISNALEIELRTLYRKASLLPPQSPALVAKQAAQGNVALMTRKEMRAGHWRTEETAALREQHKALAAKDFPAAAEATRKRLYARAMWQEIQTASKKIDSAEKYVKRYGESAVLARLGRSTDMMLPDNTRLGSAIRDAAKILVEGVGIAPLTDLSRNGSFDALVTKLEDAGLPIVIDPILRERSIKPWADLTFMEAMSVRDALKNISAVAKGLDGIRVGQNQILLNDIADEVETSMEDAGLLDRLGQKGEKQSRVRKTRADIAKPETIAIDIDNGKLGAFHRAFIQTAEAGQFENERRKRQRRQDIRALGEKYAPKDWAKQVERTHVFEADGRTYTGGEVFAMLLNWGTESNREKLVKGMQKAGRAWTNENVLAFIHEVFPDRAPYEMAQAILDYINRADLWEDSARVREEVAGVRPDKIPALAIPTPDGKSIEGGYYHVIYDNDVPLPDAEASNADALNAMHESNPLNQYAANGFTKSRTGYVAPIRLNPVAWTAHIYEVDHFISNARGIIDRHKLLQHPRIKGAIIHGLGIEYWRALRDANNFIASDGRRVTAEMLQMSSVMDKLIYHNALLTMGGNLLSGVSQVVSGLPATWSYLGPKGVPAFAKALIQFAKSPFGMWEEVVKASGEVEGMSFHYDRDLRLVAESEIAGHRWDDVKSRFAATMMSPVMFGQKLVNVITFKAAQNIALAEGKSGPEAVAFANSAVRQSQSASAPKDFTAVQRSHDGIMRVLTSLASYQFTLNDMVMPRQMTQKQLTSSVFRLATLILTTAMLRSLFNAMVPKLEEEEAKQRKGLEKAAAESEIPGLLAITEATMDVIGNVPLVGRPAQSVLSGRTPRYAAWADTIAKSIQLAPRLLEDKGFTKQEVKVLVDTVGLATGIPTRHTFFAAGEFGYELSHNGLEGENLWGIFQELALVRPGQKGKD